MRQFLSSIGTLAAAAHGGVAAISDITQVAGGNLPATLSLAGMAAVGLVYTSISSGRKDRDLEAKVDSLVRSDASDHDKAQQLIHLFNLPTEGGASNESAMVLLAYGLKHQAEQHEIGIAQVEAVLLERFDRIEEKLDEVLRRPHLTDELEAKVEAKYRENIAALEFQIAELRSDKAILRSALEFAQERAKEGDQLSEEAIEQLRHSGDTEKLLEALITDRDRSQNTTTQRNRQVAEVAYIRGDIPTAKTAVNSVLADAPNDLDALNLFAVINFVSGDLGEAERFYRRVLELAAERPAIKANTLGNLGILLRERGDYLGSEAMHRTSLEMADELGLKEVYVNQCCNLGAIYLTLGKIGAATEIYNRGLTVSAKYGLNKGMANIYCSLEPVS